MIRYDYNEARTSAAIRKVDPKWYSKAASRTRQFIKLGKFQEKSSIWSVTKAAFMELQMNKCVFCERQFETPDYGKIEFDVEHFRPKSSIARWPNDRHPNIKYGFKTGDPSPAGYFWLAYDPLNYAAACKICNTILKLNYFPIAGDRGGPSASIKDLKAEQAFLCYPIGNIDQDPEKLVTFVATTAVPAQQAGHELRRGQVIIDFFGLNEREQLHRQRAQMISLFGPALSAKANGTATKSDNQLLRQMASPVLPHANCLRSYMRLAEQVPEQAQRIFELCRAFITSESGVSPPSL